MNEKEQAEDLRAMFPIINQMNHMIDVDIALKVATLLRDEHFADDSEYGNRRFKYWDEVIYELLKLKR